MEEEIEIIGGSPTTIVKHKHIHKYEKEDSMTPAETVNLFGAGSGMGGSGAGAIGGGLGAGLLGGVLGGALLGNRGGLLGGGVDGAAVAGVTPAMLTAGLASVIDNNQNTTVLQSLGDIKASIPYAESQVQLALAGAQADINRTITNGQGALVTGQALINKNISDAIATSLASQSAIKETVATYGVANLNATNEAKYATGVAIANSTKEILAAINGNEIANLQRQLTVSESRALEDRLTSRSRDTEVTVTQTVNQNQMQLQAQSQQQQQALILNNIWSRLDGMQNAIATNSNLIVGNSGATTTGAQTAAPVNVRT